VPVALAMAEKFIIARLCRPKVPACACVSPCRSVRLMVVRLVGCQARRRGPFQWRHLAASASVFAISMAALITLRLT